MKCAWDNTRRWPYLEHVWIKLDPLSECNDIFDQKRRIILMPEPHAFNARIQFRMLYESTKTLKHAVSTFLVGAEQIEDIILPLFSSAKNFCSILPLFSSSPWGNASILPIDVSRVSLTEMGSSLKLHTPYRSWAIQCWIAIQASTSLVWHALDHQRSVRCHLTPHVYNQGNEWTCIAWYVLERVDQLSMIW